MEQTGKLFVIKVSNVTIDGTGVSIGNSEAAINIVGQTDVNLKNFIVENCEVGIYIEFSQGISIQYMSFKENNQAIKEKRDSSF